PLEPLISSVDSGCSSAGHCLGNGSARTYDTFPPAGCGLGLVSKMRTDPFPYNAATDLLGPVDGKNQTNKWNYDGKRGNGSVLDFGNISSFRLPRPTP